MHVLFLSFCLFFQSTHVNNEKKNLHVLSNCGLNFEQINGITVPACIWIHSLVVIYLRGRQIAERQKREKKRDNVSIEKSLKICLFDMDNAQRYYLHYIL